MKKKKLSDKSVKEKPRGEESKASKSNQNEDQPGVLPLRDLKKNLGCG